MEGSHRLPPPLLKRRQIVALSEVVNVVGVEANPETITGAVMIALANARGLFRLILRHHSLIVVGAKSLKDVFAAAVDVDGVEVVSKTKIPSIVLTHLSYPVLLDFS